MLHHNMVTTYVKIVPAENEKWNIDASRREKIYATRKLDQGANRTYLLFSSSNPKQLSPIVYSGARHLNFNNVSNFMT